ncbi:hypothetical protein ATI45_0338 [Marinobacter sp. LV10MA510-1]|nr:hypothetical protein ATI45_0338 [Marinobacter sp. LV10MA510-1]PFG53918.1 hypothetical protein ATG98_3096 [Marinobacter sp. LV10R520-4]
MGEVSVNEAKLHAQPNDSNQRLLSGPVGGSSVFRKAVPRSLLHPILTKNPETMKNDHNCQHQSPRSSGFPR